MISREQIFHVLPAERLRDIARYLAFDPVAEGKLFTQLAESGKLAWLDTHRDDLEDHLRWVGSSLFGKRRSYREIVLDTAKKVGAPHSEATSTPAVEQAIVSQVWNQALKGMTEEQRSKVRASVAELTSRHGKHVGKELSGFAALGAAQLSGFGIYMAGSTLLGAINGALGLGLGFGAFTGLSSLISVIIGPVGWAALGLFTVARLGGPNYKKILPVIFVIATYRAECDAAAAPPAEEPCTENVEPVLQTAKCDEVPMVGERSPTEAKSVAEVRTEIEIDVGPPVFSIPEMQALEADAKRLAVKTERATMPERPTPRKPTRRERITFCLQNPLVCIVAKRFGDTHYLEMSPSEQETIRQLVQEDREDLIKEEQRRQQEARNARKELEKTNRDNSKKNKAIAAKQTEFKVLLPNIDFNDKALDRYLFSFEDELREAALQQLKQIDNGNSRDKHHVPGTRPRLSQRDGGSGLRIYYRQNGAPNRFFVRLMGTKGTQDADYESMRG